MIKHISVEKLGIKKDFIECYLCRQKVPEKKWLDKSLRLTCLKQNKTILDQVSAEGNILCPNCGEFMRLWADKVGKFILTSEIADTHVFLGHSVFLQF